MSWGNRLVLVFIAFAALMFVLVYKAVNTRYELVSKEYYQDELRYQDKIDGIANAATISEVQILQDGEHLVVKLPEELEGQAVTGDIWLYCKTDAVKDLRLPLQVNETGRQFIPKAQLKSDKYLLKLTWQANEKKYYLEKEIEMNLQ